MTVPHVGGKPLKYKTRDDLISVINDYFAKTPRDEYSITGLALCVGSKQLIQDYEKRPMFSDIIKEAKLIVENSYELSLRKTGKAGDIFALKNFGWRDRTDLSLTEEDSETLRDSFFGIHTNGNGKPKSNGKANGRSNGKPKKSRV